MQTVHYLPDTQQHSIFLSWHIAVLELKSRGLSCESRGMRQKTYDTDQPIDVTLINFSR